jgi:tetratricopeptide (TPR) repeat protein
MEGAIKNKIHWGDHIMKKILSLLIFLVLCSIIFTPVLADDPTTTPSPDPQAVLNRAEEVALLAEITAQQNARTIDLVRYLAWFFSIIIGVTAVALGLYGFNTQRGFQESMNEYRTQLNHMQATYQSMMEQYQTEQTQVKKLSADITQKVEEIESIREELSQIKETVTSEYTAAKQAFLWLGMGNRFFNEGKRKQAIDFYMEAKRLQPDDAQINYQLGRAYSNAGYYKEAIDVLEEAVNVKPDFPEAHMELGLTYRRHAEQVPSAEERLAEYRLAERYLIRAINLRHDYEDALGALGGLYRREERYREALEYYRKAGNVDPNSSYAWNNIASLSWFLGEPDSARIAFEHVEELASERINVGREQVFWDYYDRALARLVLGQHEEALSDHRTAVKDTPEDENFHSVLDNLLFLRRAEKPIDGLEEFIAIVEEKLGFS